MYNFTIFLKSYMNTYYEFIYDFMIVNSYTLFQDL